MSLPNADQVSALVKTAKTFALDLAERTVSTGLQAGLGAVVVSQPFNLSMWESAGLAGVAAGLAVVKGVFAKLRGDSNSASLVKGV
jgi:hypothetical protein